MSPHNHPGPWPAPVTTSLPPPSPALFPISISEPGDEGSQGPPYSSGQLHQAQARRTQSSGNSWGVRLGGGPSLQKHSEVTQC